MHDFADRLAQRKRMVQIVLISTVVLAVAGGFLSWWIFYGGNQIRNPFRPNVTEAAPMPLYYPRKAPRGYSLDPASVKVAHGVVTFTLSGPDGKIIYVSEQAKPKDFDFNFFYSKVMQVTREADLPVGTAKIGTTKDRPGVLTVSLVAEPTWILITFPESLPPEEMDALLRSLTGLTSR